MESVFLWRGPRGRMNPMRLTRREIARLIDHTQVHAYAALENIRELCDEAVQHAFASVSTLRHKPSH